MTGHNVQQASLQISGTQLKCSQMSADSERRVIFSVIRETSSTGYTTGMACA